MKGVKSYHNSFFPDCMKLCLVNIAMITLSLHLYNGSFSWYHHPFSELGSLRTRAGFDNSSARLVFNLNMFANFLFFWIMGSRLHRSENLEYRLTNAFCKTAGIGMLIIMYPYDVNNTFHSVGTASTTISLTALGTIALRGTTETRFKVLNGIGWVLLLLYAAAAAVDLDSSHAVQKPVVFMVTMNLLTASAYTLKASVQESEPEKRNQAAGSSR